MKQHEPKHQLPVLRLLARLHDTRSDPRRIDVIDVIPFTESHRQGVVDVILPIQQREFGIPIKLEDQPDLLDIPGFYQKGNGNFWVALNGSEVVGTVSLLGIGNSQAALRKMFVKAPYRGPQHGVARRLLDALLHWSAQRDVCEIFLGTTAKFLAAHRFYEKNGFTEIQPDELPDAFPVMAVDTKFYKLALKGGRPNKTGSKASPC